MTSTDTALRELNELARYENDLLDSEELPSVDILFKKVKQTHKKQSTMKNLVNFYRVSIMDAETFEEKRWNVSRKRENADIMAKNARRNGYATRIETIK